MKRITRIFQLAVATLASALALTACGGGSGGGTTSTTTVSRGTIQQFGSIVVGGVEYKTAGATLHLRDDAVTPDRVLQNELEIRNHLQLGMVVTVKGRVDDNGTTGTATEIEFRDTIKGRIDNKGVDTITVMGQTILIDDSIRSTLNTLAIGDDVQISGLTDDKGGLRATFVEKKNPLTEFEAKGYVSGFTGAGDNQITLLMSKDATSGITVDITNATGRNLLVDGAFVEIKAATPAVGGVLTATKIELEDELKAGENEKSEVEGFVASFANDILVINGQTIQLTTGTVFVGGTKADLTAGMKVEVEGVISGGVLVASKVSFKDNLRIEANAIAVDTTAMTITILGKTVTYTSSTQFRDGGATIADPVTLVGKNIRVRGIMNTAGTGIIATRVDLLSANPATDAFLRGVVTAKTASTVTIAGIVVNLAGATFKDNNDAAIANMASFLAAVTVNTTAVKVRWNPFVAVTDAVKEAEIEN